MAADGELSMEEMFKGCGQAPGLAIWDVNQFKLEPVPQRMYGTFYTGDCYLVLHTYKQSADTEKLLHDVHFWIGDESSQDESGSVALFATQLDDFLGGVPVQYRQVQQLEDATFRKLFPKLTYRRGGRHKSGFKHVEAEAKGPTRLYQVKSPSANSIQVLEVPVSVDSLCHGDSFVLEVPQKDLVYLWQGSAANVREKIKAREVATSMRADSGTIKLDVIDYDDTSSVDAKEFFGLLGCDNPAKVEIREASEHKGSPVEVASQNPRLFRLDGQSAVEISGGLSKSKLTPEGQFGVLVSSSVWVWMGPEAPKGDPFGAAQALLQAERLPKQSPIRCVKSGREPLAFTSLFSDW